MSILAGMNDNHVFRYGLVYGSRMQWMRSSAQVLKKIALANKTWPEPRDVADKFFHEDEVADAWERYNTLAVWRLGDTFDAISKSDKMLNYARLYYARLFDEV